MLKSMKKALSFLLVITLLMSMMTMAGFSNIGVSATSGTYQIGDVDQDGEITITDATYIQWSLVALIELDADQQYLADVDGDGEISITDATYIQWYLVNMLDEFPENKDGKKLGDKVTLENGQIVTEPVTQPVTQAPDTYTVKFTNNQGWTDVYLYAWNDSDKNAEWPGVKLTDKSVNGYQEEQYTATFDSKYTKIIFSNGGEEQTVDITYDPTVTGYYPTEKEGDKWKVNSWTDTPETGAATGEATQAPTAAPETGDATQAPTAAPSGTYTVKFTNNQGWTDVYLYAWGDDGKNAEWPGVKLTDKTVNGYQEEQYTATFDSKYTKIIFNNGGSEQTVDIDYDNKVTGYYPTEKEGDKWKVDSWTDAPETGEATQAPTAAPETGEATQAPSGTYTVKFTNNQRWTDVYLYAWGDDGKNAEWPGVKLTDKTVNGYQEEQYTATFDSKYTKIIFNNGGSEQTVDIDYDNKVTGYYPTEKEGDKWKVDSWTDAPETGAATGEATQAPTAAPETGEATQAPSGTYTVKFTNNQGWTDVYLYAWGDDGKNAEWPGVKLTDKSVNGYQEEQYTATFDSKYTKIIFNNGGSEQTVDIDYDNKVTGYYPTEKEGDKWKVDSWTDAPETGEATQAPTSAQGDSLTYYYLPLAADVTAGYTFKLNLNDEGGSDPENWHQYTLTKTDDKVDGVNVYKVTFKPGFEKANEVQFQTWNGDEWKKQVNVNEGNKTVLKDLDGKLVKSDGTVAEYKPESTGDEPSTQAPTAAPSGKYTVKFTNNQGWTDVYLYAWGDDGKNAEWPGVKLTDKTVNGYQEEQYTATFDSKYTKIIFNNGGSEQTVDIDYDNKVTGYYPTEKEGDKWKVDSWTDAPETGEATQAPTAAPETGEATQAPSGTYTVKFTNNQRWTDVYLYAWGDDGKNAEWPGVKLTDKTVNGYQEEQYTATFDSKYTKIIFNNGGSEQTVDIDYDNKVTGYYPTEKEGDKWKVDSWTDAPETGAATGEATQAPTAAPETGEATQAPSGTYTVKFTNNQGWTDVYLYAWGDDGKNAEWPGVKLTDKTVNGYQEEQYTATFDSKYTKIIFNNGGSEQTVDIDYDNKVTGYYPTEKEGDKWKVDSWTDAPETGEATQAPTAAPETGEATQAPTAAPADKYTVKFTNNQRWTDVYVYAWADGAGDDTKNAEWPGVKLTDKTVNGYQEEQYTATIDAKFTNLIFNNGGSEQTVDIKYDGKATGYYPTEKEGDKWKVDSWTDAPETGEATGEATQAPTSAQGDSLTYYYLPLAADVTAGYTFKLNLNDEGGSDPENWHQYTLTKTDEKVDGVNVYKVTFKPGFEKANEVQFQTWNGDEWKKQVKVNEGNKTVLKDLDGKLVKSDGTVAEYKPESTGDEPSTQAPTAAPSGKYTVKFTNNQRWTDVYLYAWGDDGKNAEWPGVKLTNKTVNGYQEEQYTATFDSKYTKIIFNNGGSEQTVDIDYDNKVTGYYPTEKEGDKWKVDSWTDAPETGEATQAPTAAPETGEATQAPSGTYTVKFTNNQGWTDVYLYAWGDDGKNAEWPGVKLTDKTVNGYQEEQYTATFDSKYTKIIFNNGGSEQTVDIDYDNKVTGYYPTEKEGDKWKVDSWTDAPETGEATQAPTSGEGTQAPTSGEETQAPTSAPSDKNTVKFTNNQGWTDVYLYAWSDAGSNAEWPGVKLTDKSTNTYNEEQYTATFDSKYTKIIFNNGGSEQTVDITYDNKVTGYYPTEKKDGKWEVESWTDGTPDTGSATQAPTSGEGTQAPTQAPTSAPSDKNTVKFTNNQSWTDVYLYAWSDAGSNAEWPGVKLTDKSVNTYNEEQYTGTFDSKYTKIIFNNGGSEQTVDITYDNKVTGYYPTEKKDGKWEVESWTDGTPDTGSATQAPTSADADSLTYYYLPLAADVTANYTFKLNLNDEGGSAPENWHQYTFTKTDDKVGGVNVYKVTFKPGFDKANEVQFQTWNGDNWVKQVQVNEGKKTVLKDLDGKLVKADGSVVDYKPESSGDEPATQAPTSAPSGTYTVKFTNNQNWTDVYVYAWADGAGAADKNAEWPGVKLTDKVVNTYNEEQYTATIDSKFTNLIFNNGGSEQTVDIKYDGKVSGYYPTEKKDGKWEVGSWTDTNPETQAPTSGEGTQAPTSGEETQAPTSAPSDKNTVKFTNNQNWTDVYLYAWSDAGSNAEWPGVKLTDKVVNTYNEEQYTATFDSKYTKIIFNNGGSEQTVDITYDNKVTGYYPTEKKDGKWEVGFWTDTNPETQAPTSGEGTQAPTSGEETQAPTQAPTAAPSGTYTVKFTNNQNWTDVYVYAWADGAGAADKNAEWPGVKLTDKVVNTYNEEQYTATIDSKFTNLIFNNGSTEQTADIKYDGKVSGFYPTEKKDGKWEVGSWTDETPDTGSVTQAPTSADADSLTYYYLPLAADVTANYTFKLNLNDEGGSAPENWHQYTFTKTDEKVGGVNVYKVTFKPGFEKANEVQFQTWNGDNWVKQVQVNEGKKTVLKDLDGKLVKTDGSVVDYKPESTGDEPATQTPTNAPATQAPATVAPSDKNTVKFTNNQNWTDVYLYAWNDAGTNAEWPGVKLTDKVVNTYNEEQYTGTFDSKYTKIIFNNGGSEQTVDITYDNKVTGYYPTEKKDGKWEVGSWTDTNPETQAPTAAPATGEATQAPTSAPTVAPTTTESSDTITVYFTDSMFYGDVNVYYWQNGGAWPGKAMTKVNINEYSQQVYSAEIPADVDGIIFNGNGRQTVDITENIKNGAWWYALETTDDAGHNRVQLVNVEPETAAPTQAPTEAPETVAPTAAPTEAPETVAPTQAPTEAPTEAPTAAPTAAPSDKNTVKFTNNQNWTDVYLYAWSDAGSNAEWPGVKLTDKAVNTYNEEQYTATFDTKYTKIIFNNGGSEQTVDITYDNKVTGYYPTEKKDNKWEVGSWTDAPATGEATQAPTAASTAASTAAPETQAPDNSYTYYFVPASTPAAGYTIKLNINDEAGTDSQYWHQFTMTKTDDTSGGVPVYKATFTADYTKANQVQFQTWNGDQWVTQTTLGEGTKIALADLDEKLVKADDGSVNPYEVDNGSVEGTDIVVTNPADTTKSVKLDLMAVSGMSGQWRVYTWNDNEEGIWTYIYNSSATVRDNFLLAHVQDHSSVNSWDSVDVKTIDVKSVNNAKYYLLNEKNTDGHYILTTTAPETVAPTQAPTEAPATDAPTQAPTVAPTEAPTVAPTQAPTESNTYTFKFTNNRNWADVYLYAWNNDGSNAQWPGVKLTDKATNDYGEVQYTVTLPKQYTSIIFNSGSNGEQTEDIAFDSTVAGYYVKNEKDSSGHYKVGSWK